jgi:hypothetical protein
MADAKRRPADGKTKNRLFSASYDRDLTSRITRVGIFAFAPLILCKLNPQSLHPNNLKGYVSLDLAFSIFTTKLSKSHI